MKTDSSFIIKFIFEYQFYVGKLQYLSASFAFNLN